MTYYTPPKNVNGRTLHDMLHKGFMRQTHVFNTVLFATASSHIHVEFLNGERGKEKAR